MQKFDNRFRTISAQLLILSRIAGRVAVAFYFNQVAFEIFRVTSQFEKRGLVLLRKSCLPGSKVNHGITFDFELGKVGESLFNCSLILPDLLAVHPNLLLIRSDVLPVSGDVLLCWREAGL